MKVALKIPDLLGQTIQTTRRSKGIKAEDMLDVLGICAHHYSDIENGRSKPGYNLLIATVRYLGIDPNVFFYPEREHLDVKRLQLIHAIETCSDERVDTLIAIMNGLPKDSK